MQDALAIMAIGLRQIAGFVVIVIDKNQFLGL
jgi:hypothetical protein